MNTVESLHGNTNKHNITQHAHIPGGTHMNTVESLHGNTNKHNITQHAHIPGGTHMNTVESLHGNTNKHKHYTTRTYSWRDTHEHGGVTSR